MNIKITCPLGSQCEIRDGDKHERCAWYTKVVGKNPQSEEMIDEWRCAIAWMPVMQIEHSLFERQTGAAVEQVRNIFSAALNPQIGNNSQDQLEKKDA